MIVNICAFPDRKEVSGNQVNHTMTNRNTWREIPDHFRTLLLLTCPHLFFKRRLKFTFFLPEERALFILPTQKNQPGWFYWITEKEHGWSGLGIVKAGHKLLYWYLVLGQVQILSFILYSCQYLCLLLLHHRFAHSLFSV